MSNFKNNSIKKINKLYPVVLLTILWLEVKASRRHTMVNFLEFFYEINFASPLRKFLKI